MKSLKFSYKLHGVTSQKLIIFIVTLVRLLVLPVNNELEKMWMEVVVAYNGLVGLNTTEGLRRTDIRVWI